MANKVKYGLSNVYYAKATIAADGSATYETPVAIAGAVSLSLSAQGENSPFYADNIKYYITSSNTGYEGDVEFAMIPDSFRKDILGEIEDDNGVIIEDSGASANPFALLFQFEGDDKGTRHVMYNCTATRPNVEGSTKEDSTEVQTETMSISCGTVYNASLQKNIVKARCLNDGKSATTYNSWNNEVYQPTNA